MIRLSAHAWVAGMCFALTYAIPSQAIDTRFTPVEGNGGASDVVTLGGDRFHRDTYDVIGAIAAFVTPLFDLDDNYLVQPGETWSWIIRQTSGTPFGGSVVRAQFDLSFLGGDNLCWSNGFCGAVGGWILVFLAPCMVEEDHEIELLHNGQSVGKRAFRPTRFKPEVFRLDHSAVIEPVIPPGQAVQPAGPTATSVLVIVKDDKGCLVPLPDVTVRLTNTIAASAGDHLHAHTHFGAGEIGTGRWTCFDSASCTVVDDKSDATDTIVEGTTGADGRFGALYSAGELGVVETLTVSLTRAPTEKDPEEVKGEDATSVLDIKLPNLVNVNAPEIDAIRVDGGGCPHSPTANWMTPQSSTRLSEVTRNYQQDTGRMLSLNDASLPFGGLFDNAGGGGRASVCHKSHMVGRDIDLNRIDSGGKKLRCRTDEGPDCKADTYTENGREQELIQLVIKLFGEKDGDPIKEGNSIHFRFPN